MMAAENHSAVGVSLFQLFGEFFIVFIIPDISGEADNGRLIQRFDACVNGFFPVDEPTEPIVRCGLRIL